MSEPLSDERLEEMRKCLDDLLAWHLRSQELGATEPGPPNEALWLADDLQDLLQDRERLRAQSEQLREEGEQLRAENERLRAECERLREQHGIDQQSSPHVRG